MSKPVLIVENFRREPPSSLTATLSERGIPHLIHDFTEGGEFPDTKPFGAVVVLGGPDSANDDTPKMHTEIAAVQDILAREVAYLGICLGHQVLVKAAGGTVRKNEIREAGFYDPEGELFTVNLTDAGKADPLFTGLKHSLPVCQLHGDTVDLNDKVQLLANGKWCEIQAVKVGNNAYGLQGHFELTTDTLDRWAREDRDLKNADRGMVMEHFRNIRAQYRAVWNTLFNNFLDIAGY